MKASTLNEWLSCHIRILDMACGASGPRNLRRLADLLAIRPQSTVSDVCTIIARVEPSEGGRVTVASTAELLNALVESGCKLAKVSDANDLRKFAAVIASRGVESFEAFASRASEALAPRPAPTQPASLTDADLRAYVKRLEEALGDEVGFESVYQQISKDGRLKAADAKKLAKAFAGKSGKSKADALGLIYGRRENLMSAKPKADATGRRLAG